MANFNFRYFIQSIPQLIAADYIKRTYNWHFVLKRNTFINLFVRYYDGQTIPPSYLATKDAFPENCLHEPNSPLGPRFILAADLVDFSSILIFLSSLSCQHLYQDVIGQLESDFSPQFKIGDNVWDNQHPKVMGILNITPDSFYDGGEFFGLSDYSSVVEKMIQAGVDIIDIGGESTRPGAQSISADEEINRVLPVVKQIRDRFHIPLSVDTVKPDVAKAVLDNGVELINDTSGLSAGNEMLKVLLKYKSSYCLMHTQGKPVKMQDNPFYYDPIAEVYSFFKNKLLFCRQMGMDMDHVLIDPGIGFGKTFNHNMDLLRFLPAFSNLNQTILLGTSNKSFLNHALQRGKKERLYGSLATQAMGWIMGAVVFRVHNILETKDVVQMTRLYSQR